MFNVKKIEMVSKLLTNYYRDSRLQWSSLPTCLPVNGLLGLPRHCVWVCGFQISIFLFLLK